MINGVPKVFYFTDRHKIAREIKLPENNDCAPYMVVGPNALGTGYKQIDYNKFKLWFKLHMTKEEVNKMILAFNNLHSYALAKQKEIDTYNDSNFCWKSITFMALASFVVATVIFVYVQLYNSKYQYMKKAMQLAFFSAMFSVLLSILLALVSCKPLPRHVDFNETLTQRMTRMIDHYNNLYRPKGLVVVPGKRFVWLELWKVRFMDSHPRPIISLIGRDPIVDYDPNAIESLLQAKEDELRSIYKPRGNVKYKKLSYLDDFYNKEADRKMKELKATEANAARLRAEEEANRPRLSLIPELDSNYEASGQNISPDAKVSDPNFRVPSTDNDASMEGASSKNSSIPKEKNKVGPKPSEASKGIQSGEDVNGQAGVGNQAKKGKETEGSTNSINQIQPKINDDMASPHEQHRSKQQRDSASHGQQNHKEREAGKETHDEWKLTVEKQAERRSKWQKDANKTVPPAENTEKKNDSTDGKESSNAAKPKRKPKFI